MPKPPEDSCVRTWLIAHGIDAPFQLHADLGFVNWVYFVGDDLVLRITKEGISDEDARTEAVAVPAVCSAGLRTPALIEFDSSHACLSATVTLYKRANGVTLGQTHVESIRLPPLYQDIGREVGRLHHLVKSVPDPQGWLDRPCFFDARSELDRARKSQKIEAVSYEWIAAWLDSLEPAFETEAPRVFLHNDLHPFNTLVSLDPLRLEAVLDWGDAGWGDPVLDFGTLPIWAIDWVLSGYEEVMGEVDDGFMGRLVWHDIGAALDATTEPWVETSEPWQPLTTSRWLNLTRWLANSPGRRWRRWLPPAF